MPFAILQTDLNIPAVDSLRRAFRYLKSLTDMDAHILARDAYGILVKNLTEHEAGTLQGALLGEGIQTEIVDQSLLPEMPPTKFVHRLDCRPDALHLYDPLGRQFSLDWGHLMLIAAGRVRLNDWRRVEKKRHVTRYDWQGVPHTEVVRETRQKEELQDHLAVELILTRAVLRYSLVADKFNFQYLGDRLSRDRMQNFNCLVRDLTRLAPQATVNRGAYYLRQGGAETTSYPSKNAFFEEITWLLWRMRTSET